MTIEPTDTEWEDVMSSRAATARPAGAGQPIRTHWLLVGIESLVAVAALYGRVGLIWDDKIGMPADFVMQRYNVCNP